MSSRQTQSPASNLAIILQSLKSEIALLFQSAKRTPVASASTNRPSALTSRIRPSRRLPFAFDFNVRTHFDVGPRPRFIYSRVRCFEGTLVTICSGSHFSVSAAFPMQGKTPVSWIHFDHDASNRSLYFSWPLRTYYGQHSILPNLELLCRHRFGRRKQCSECAF